MGLMGILEKNGAKHRGLEFSRGLIPCSSSVMHCGISDNRGGHSEIKSPGRKEKQRMKMASLNHETGFCYDKAGCDSAHAKNS